MEVTIRTTSTATKVKNELSRITGQEQWKDNREWREFLALRREFLSAKSISWKPSVAEKKKLESEFKEWVNASSEWWHGDWVNQPGLVEWHVVQYLRRRGYSEQFSEPALDSHLPGPPDSQDHNKPYDPVYDT